MVAAGHNVMLLAFLLLALPALVGVWRRLGAAYGVYLLAALALPLSTPVTSQPLMSLPRFLVVLFPLSIWAAAWLAPRRRLAIATLVSALCLWPSSWDSSRHGIGWPEGTRGSARWAGTLVALRPPWEALTAGLWRDYGIELSAAEAEWAFAAEMHYYRAHHLEGHDVAALQGLRRRCAEVLHAALPLRVARALSLRQVSASMLDALRFSAYPDALFVLPLLRARGIRLVVVSNWDVSLAPTLRGLGLSGMLDGVITSAQVGVAKPAPEVFRAALGLLDISPEEALHVGDDPRLDVLGARAAGVLPVLLRRAGEGASEARAGEGASEARAGVATIASLAELPRLL